MRIQTIDEKDTVTFGYRASPQSSKKIYHIGGEPVEVSGPVGAFALAQFGARIEDADGPSAS